MSMLMKYLSQIKTAEVQRELTMLMDLYSLILYYTTTGVVMVM